MTPGTLLFNRFAARHFCHAFAGLTVCFVCWAVEGMAAEPDRLPSGTNAPSFTTSRTNNAAPANDLASFKLISDRNIFNLSRTSRSARGGDAEKPNVPKVDFFTLVGTLSYSNRQLAFFDGSAGDYRRSVVKEELIAGYRVVEVQPSQVKLSWQGTNVSLPVGGQMKRTDDGPWGAVSGSEKVVASASPSAPSGSDSAASKGGDTAGDDVLARLLKKRAKEQKNEKP